ncbi:MAG: crotonase/enoyl-CoA hydratase family protein [Actinomycetota bacterium]|nr:crotonase/enoyl-CoA hydratase family protein [Actinomycetota bacterium]
MNDRIAIYREGGIADVRLNRPEKMNALDKGMFAALVETAEQLANDPTLRCVVLSGEGRSFCAGLDFASFQGMANEGSDSIGDITAADEGRITHFGQQAVYGWTTLPVPVIAAINGHALGGGIQLALGADIRIIAPNARMSVLESRWGLIPDMTGTQSLVGIVGLDVAKELTFTGRMVDGNEAVRIGLATRVADDPHAAAMELAREIAAKSPEAIRAAKRLFNAAPKVSAAEGFAQERTEISRLIGSPNQIEAVKAFFEKRPPEFADPAE